MRNTPFLILVLPLFAFACHPETPELAEQVAFSRSPPPSGRCTDDTREENDTALTAHSLVDGRGFDYKSCPNDDDWYRIHLEEGDVLRVLVEFAQADGNIDAELYTPRGALIVASDGLIDDESVQYLSSIEGWFRLRVFLTDDSGALPGASYDLRVIIERRRPQLALGLSHSCELKETGAARCWGTDTWNTSSPPDGDYGLISAGGEHTCALDLYGEAHCWGSDDISLIDAPATPFTAIGAGAHASCAIDRLGAISCWGSSESTLPVQPGGRFQAVGVGSQHACALDMSGHVDCWGANEHGQSSPPVGEFIELAVGFDFNCAADEYGAITCWGQNLLGQASPPEGVFNELGAGQHSACARSWPDGQIVCWGFTGYGATEAESGVYTALGVGGAHACGLRASGQIDCWGLNHAGQACDQGELDIDVEPPQLLAETCLYSSGKDLAEKVSPFEPTYALWSDGAGKQRMVYLPSGGVIDTSNMDFWVLPIGARVWKEFSVGGNRIETRLIERTGPGPNDYIFAAYHWDADEEQAVLVPFEGLPLASGTNHDIPSLAQCKACHGGGTTGGVPGRVLGFSALQLSHSGPGVTLDDLIAEGRLSNPPAATPVFPGSGIEKSSIGYMHANCGHCHNTVGGLSGFNFDLWTSVNGSAVGTTAIGVPAFYSDPGLPQECGGQSCRIKAGDHEASAIWFRMENHTMPQIGTKLVDQVKVDMIRDWIDSL